MTRAFLLICRPRGKEAALNPREKLLFLFTLQRLVGCFPRLLCRSQQQHLETFFAFPRSNASVQRPVPLPVFFCTSKASVCSAPSPDARDRRTPRSISQQCGTDHHAARQGEQTVSGGPAGGAGMSRGAGCAAATQHKHEQQHHTDLAGSSSRQSSFLPCPQQRMHTMLGPPSGLRAGASSISSHQTHLT